MNTTCINCAEYRRCRESALSWVFFIVGLISTIALRVVTMLAHWDPVYGQVAWYIGVAGFLAFFVYKFRVDRQRYRLILNRGLREKLSGDNPLAREDRALIAAILCALSSNKDRINYFVIFVSSAMALLIAIYFDFMR